MSVEHSSNLEKAELNSLPIVEFRKEFSTKNADQFAVYDSSEDYVGYITIDYSGENNTAHIIVTRTLEEYHDKGFGKAIYRKAIEASKERGVKLKSSDLLSEQATNVWKSLVRDGLAEETENGDFIAI